MPLRRRFRVVTWNIHGAIGRSGRVDDDRVLAAVRRLAPDLLALQEIDGRTHFGRQAHAFERYAERLGPHLVEARTVTREGGRDFGHLLWSRWPIRSAHTLTLPGPGLEKRLAIVAEVTMPEGDISVIAVHMGLLPFVRRQQAAFLARHFEPMPGPVLLLGDTNEWNPVGGVDRVLRRHLPHRSRRATFPARAPMAPLDRIYAGRGIRITGDRVDEEARTASDHRALVADCLLATE